MSSSAPPPPTGPPSGPPTEYLESGAGGPIPPSPPPRRSGVKRGLFVGGGVVGLAAVGIGAWAAYGFFSQGAQPAEALPADTLGYVSVDLDPAGGQKLEALDLLKKFPALKDEIGGVDADSDIKKFVVDKIQEESGCDDLDYAKDVEPWLGDRAAVAAVDTGADEPSPVFVVQVKDADAVDAGLEAIKSCGGGGDEGGWTVEGDWVVIAESEDVAKDVVASAKDGTLADDADFQKWTGETGDSGVMSMYAGPGLGTYLADHPEALDLGGQVACGVTGSMGLSSDGMGSDCSDVSSGDQIPEELAQKLKEFKGAAATVRFSDGAVELEAAGDGTLAKQSVAAGGGTADVVGSLPSDTIMAFGLGFADGWFSDLVDQIAPYSGTSADDLMSELSAMTGLDLPGDAETLAGDSMALSVGHGFDPSTFFGSGDGSNLPVALKIKGDPDAIEGVVTKLTDMMGSASGFIGTSKSGDSIAIGPDSEYRDQVLEDGELADSEVYQDVIRESGDASTVLFVNVNEIEDVISSMGMMGSDQEFLDNLEPISGFGATGWLDGDVAHGVVRLSTDQ